MGMKRIACLIMLVSVALAGCNTMQGLGKDVEKTGEAIQRKAQ
jgi:predicted small secreted protein